MFFEQSFTWNIVPMILSWNLVQNFKSMRPLEFTFPCICFPTTLGHVFYPLPTWALNSHRMITVSISAADVQLPSLSWLFSFSPCGRCMVSACTLMRIRLLPPFSLMLIYMSLSLIGVGLIPWAAIVLGMMKPTPAILSSPPLPKIVWLLPVIFPAPGRRTLLKAQMWMPAFSNSRQIRAFARSGRVNKSLLLVVRTFQVPRLRRCLFELDPI